MIPSEHEAAIRSEYEIRGPKAVAEQFGLNKAKLCVWASRNGVKYRGKPIRTHTHRAVDPTPDEIEERKAEIRRSW